MPASPPRSIAVVGAGLSGLTAAWRLHRAGHAVTVFERSPRVGGAIVTERHEGWLVEGGPNSLQLTAPVAAVLDELGLGSARIVAAPAAKKRFLVRDGRFLPVPTSPPAFLGTPLFSLRTKLAIFAELLTRPRTRTTDLSLAELVRSHFTQELVDYAVNPLIAGIYAGDPEKLSTRHAFKSLWEAERSHGSLLRGMMAGAKARRARGEGGVPPIISFPEGLATLPAALAAALPAGALRLGATVETLLPGRPWKLVIRQDGASRGEEFDAVVLTVPAGTLADLVFGPLGERPLASLENLPHPPVSSLFLGFRREQVAHPLDGFGGLVPAIERRRILGALFSSTLFPGRAPAGHVALTIFVGGMRQPETARLETSALVAHVAPDLHDLLGVTGEPVFVRRTFWPRAIPQYNLGHERFAEPLTRCEQQHPGLFIGGNVRDGISLPDCLQSGTRLAGAVTDFLARR